MKTLRYLVIAWSVMCVGVFCLSGCSSEPDYVGKCVVVFLDRSGSVKSDANIYADAFGIIRESLRSKDRIVIANITANSSRDFNAFLDIEIPDPLDGVNRLLETDADYQKKTEDSKTEINAALSEVEGEIDRFLATPSNSPLTAIMEATHISQQIFAADERRAVLVLLSDMVEESESLNMTRNSFKGVPADTALARMEEIGLVPDLAGVEVFIAGAMPGGNKDAVKVSEFWQLYFDAAGAHLGNGHYARHLSSFVDNQ